MKNEEIEENTYIDNNEFYEDDEHELLEENQTRSQYAPLFIGLGILFTLVAGVIFYFLLKDAPPPVKVAPTQRIKIEQKKFIPDEIKKEVEIKKEEDLPLLPNIPDIIQQEPKVYIHKIIKGGGGTLDIHSTSKEAKSVIKKELPKKVKPKGYTGGISTVAGIHHFNQNLSLPRGTLIPCNMNTRLISMVSGQLTCTIAEDVYSVNGNVLLIEKGSTAVGSYESGSMQNGVNRLYAIWEDIRTPNNIVISIGSGAADELGSAGMVGEVDNHWAMRFGGAILLSIIDDGISMISRQHGSNELIINSSTSNANRMGQRALNQYINIPPTLYKNHGDLVNIFVNKDIDFSEVYGLER